ncbi:MAG TPA: efflux RND transporter permease subunit [Bacteroidaceae bacterium]|nr:efflux RND transporter permease subunit [Bacteroidaceae bacterium]
MKKLIKFSVRNPVTILMLVLAILLLGKISYDKLSLELLPNLNTPRLFIEINAGERPPEEIEKQFIVGMESMVARQSDVQSISSVIRAGTARITVEYSWRKDMDEAFLDLEKALNSYAQDSRISELKITQNNPNDDPIVLLSLVHKEIKDMAELRKVASSYVKNELMRIDGIADVTLSGDEMINLIIETDPYKLEAFGLTAASIASKIQETNQRISGGRVTEQGVQYIVSGVNLLADEKDFGNIVLGYKATESASGNVTVSSEFVPVSRAPIYLQDVSTIRFENTQPDNIVRVNGERCIGLSVYKEMSFNTVKAVEGVANRLVQIEKALPGYEFNIISNQAVFIKDAIGQVKNSALLGVVLAVIVLFVFLRRIGTTFIVSMAIPISIIATFNLMFFNGLTLNIMTLGGLALGAGMLVDNAIVVIESIFQNQERGLSVRESVLKGTHQVAGAVTASTLTTIVVFLPIVYLHGATGELFKDQAWTVTFSLLSSLFVAIMVIPVLYDKVFGGKKEKTEKAVIKKQKESLNISGYGKLLQNIVERRWLVIIGAIFMIIGTFFLIPLLGTEFMPKAEGKVINVGVKMDEGTRLERTASAVGELEQLIYSITQDSACVVYSHIGRGANSSNSLFDGENTATIKIILSESSKILPENLMEILSDFAENIDGLELSILMDENSISSLMGNEGAPLVVEIKGEDLNILADLTERVKSIVEPIEGLYNVISSVEKGAPEIVLSVNRSIAGMNNINVSTIVSQIQQQLEGTSAGQMDYRGEMRDILIKVPGISLSDFNNITITGSGKNFKLVELADIQESRAPREILRRNQNRITSVTAHIEDNIALDKAANKIRESVSQIELPVNYSIIVTGEEEKRAESMHSLLLALVLSIILVYMVMASQFESLLHPFTILLTIPIAIVGAIWLFLITGITINIMGVIGLVMLAGIAVNNSIILVDRISQIKDTGVELKDAIVRAGQQRIRPILMTSLTTILALLPMAIGLGEGSGLSSPMAIAVIGGLVTSTIMSLVVIPCVYYVFESLNMRIVKKNQQSV